MIKYTSLLLIFFCACGDLAPGSGDPIPTARPIPVKPFIITLKRIQTEKYSSSYCVYGFVDANKLEFLMDDPSCQWGMGDTIK